MQVIFIWNICVWILFDDCIIKCVFAHKMNNNSSCILLSILWNISLVGDYLEYNEISILLLMNNNIFLDV